MATLKIQKGNQLERAGFGVNSWCDAINISKSKLYALPPEKRPRSVKLGGQRIIIEAPADYLNRMAAEQP